ncbi:twin-arginine translocase subunit TatC [Halopelagius longus]|uniref:Preprotein translocase subunit TatC n=1 Tax=Halopelagius longus TaxID=1236180 RepID=A0A1H0YP67_9EURY|nr:twin-arginine translocase subunit TatC [Halopelagius longus]RDI72600.1 preprotein translocase subunit TatC [Halopelagius longus]SDQ16930.1 Sec-independent protein secretion pathway component TatC [Halopelagius longus]
MPSEATRAPSGTVSWRTTLGAVVHARAQRLVAVFALTTIAVTAVFVLTGFDLQTLLPAAFGPVEVSPLAQQVEYNRLAVEIAILVGVVAAALFVAPHLVRHEAVEFSRARRPLAVAAVGFVAGTAAGRTLVLPAMFELFADSLVDIDAAVGPYWVTELGLFFPVTLGVAAAFPALLVGAVRAGLLPRLTTARHRTFAAVPFLVFSATHAPPTPTTFVLYAAPLFAGLGVGVAWLEFADSPTVGRYGEE